MDEMSGSCHQLGLAESGNRVGECCRDCSTNPGDWMPPGRGVGSQLTDCVRLLQAQSKLRICRPNVWKNS